MSGLEKIAARANLTRFKTLLVAGFYMVFTSLTVNAQELNLAPDCSQATAEPNLLWPPNNKFVPIQINGITDPDNHLVTIETQCIVQDEPVEFWRWYSQRYDGDGLMTGSPSVRARRRPSFFSWQDLQWVKSKGRVYDIVFKATDSQGAMCSGKVNVGVPLSKKKPVIDNVHRYPSLPDGKNCDALPINNPPVIYSVAVIEARVNTAYQYEVKGHDPDSDVLQYALISAPQGMSIDTQTGLIQWTPVAQQEGAQAVVVNVTDTGGLHASQSFEITVQPALDELTAAIIANPTTGTSPLTVRFSPDVQNNNIVINGYAWDFNGDDIVDKSDTFGAPQTYIYTGSPGDSFNATLTVTPASGDPLIASKTITIDNQAPSVQVSTSVTNGHVPLAVTFTVVAQDPQGISEISIDYDGDGTFDDTQSASGSTSGSWEFQTTYQNEGNYLAVVRVTDGFGAETRVANNAITVDVNNPLDPVIQLSASPMLGNTPLTTNFSASATVFDGSVIAQWRWDLDGNGDFETQGGTGASDSVTFIYSGVDYYYPSVEVVTNSGRRAKASLRIETQSAALPSLSIPNSSDTINSDVGEMAAINVSLPYETQSELWIESAAGVRVKTVQARQLTAAGSYSFTWDATDDQGDVVSEGDYYAVLGYTTYGLQEEIDLRTSTGGQLSYYRRPDTNPRTFDRLKQPLVINYAVDDPAEVSFFWQISFGARLMTLLEHERMGRGQYSLYWNGEFPSGQKIPDNLNTLMPGIVRYSLPSNVIFVKENPRIENFVLKSTIIADPRREPIGINLSLSKVSTVELIVSDMEKGVDVATRVYSDVAAGEQKLIWDGKNNDDQYLSPGDYRIGVRSVDSKGSRSLYWYRTQRIEY